MQLFLLLHLRGVDFFTNFLKKSEEEPLDLADNPLPVRMTYKAWSIFLGQLSASSYWCVQELAQETSVRPKEFPPCVLQPKSKTGQHLPDGSVMEFHLAHESQPDIMVYCRIPCYAGATVSFAAGETQAASKVECCDHWSWVIFR